MTNPELEKDSTKKSRLSSLFSRAKPTTPSPTQSNDPTTPSSTAPFDSLIQDTPPREDGHAINSGLSKSRTGLLAKIGHVFKGRFNLNDALFDDLEEALISSDVGIEASLSLVEALRERIKHDKLQTVNEVREAFVAVVAQALRPAEQSWSTEVAAAQKPYVILVVGVNGVGKTTTIAKIARHLKDRGQRVMLAAADTFRAAAVEQLQSWGKQLDIPVIAQGSGAEAAAVAHDAYSSALAKNMDVLIIDTAGRLHTQNDLMQQLEKVKRVVHKMNPHAPHEVMQILDAGTGQNALNQLAAFSAAVGVSSVCMTKLDGSARGGMALAITAKFKLPIRFIGVGESYADLRVFDSGAFAQALIPSLEELQRDA